MGKLPKGFLLGASTAAHQVEGNNIHSDYWALEQMEHSDFAEPSLDAVGHYGRYEEDIRLMAEAGLNAYRFSIEWARIEPEEGRFQEAEVEHYRKVIRCCKENGIRPIVTMLHFTSPKWLIESGGWEAESTVGYFKRYCAYIAERLGEELEYVCTINEANMGLQIAAIGRRYLQQMQKQMAAKQSGGSGAESAEARQNSGSGAVSAESAAEKLDGSVQVGINMESFLAERKAAQEEMERIFGTAEPQTFVSSRTPEGDLLVMRAHEAARDAMKAACPHLKIGLTLSLHDIQAQPGGEEAAEKEWKEEFQHYLPFIRQDDFLGLQNYTRTLMGAEGSLPAPEGAELTQMNYEFYPEALEHVIRKVAEEFRGDILVTENGIATADDARRVEFIRRALQGISACLEDGIPVKGYLHYISDFNVVKTVDIDLMLRLLDMGVNVGFDSWDMQVGGFPTNTDRLKALVELLRRGYGEQIVMGHDVYDKSRGVAYGYTGYTGFIRNALPTLRQLGFEKEVGMLTTENPAKILAY